MVLNVPHHRGPAAGWRRPGERLRIDLDRPGTYHRAPMSTGLPEVLDAARAVAARRHFQGTLPLSALPRLASSLAHDRGEVRYALEFGRDELGVAFVAVRAEASLPMTCQRTLEVFSWALSLRARLGIIAREQDEAGLPPGYEPLLCQSGELHPAEVIEDELILALPTVPVKPGADDSEEPIWRSEAPDDEDEAPPEPEHPFAALRRLKTH